jgi:hypothetical protein
MNTLLIILLSAVGVIVVCYILLQMYKNVEREKDKEKDKGKDKEKDKGKWISGISSKKF